MPHAQNPDPHPEERARSRSDSISFSRTETNERKSSAIRISEPVTTVISVTVVVQVRCYFWAWANAGLGHVEILFLVLWSNVARAVQAGDDPDMGSDPDSSDRAARLRNLHKPKSHACTDVFLDARSGIHRRYQFLGHLHQAHTRPRRRHIFFDAADAQYRTDIS
jgi:hypothetical protein